MSSGNVLLSCGEDFDELSQTLEPLLEKAGRFIASHEYRCYRFVQYERFTLAWTGIGTGCLEPLLNELLMSENEHIQRIILIGTADIIGGNLSHLGHIYAVENAYLCGSAIQLHPSEMPLQPNFARLHEFSDLESGTAVSTDFYYATSRNDDHWTKCIQGHDTKLRREIDEYLRPGSLVEMETAQFY